MFSEAQDSVMIVREAAEAVTKPELRECRAEIKRITVDFLIDMY